MFSSFVFWPWFIGLLFLIVGLVLARKRVAGLPWIEKLLAVGPVFFAAALAAFGAEHFAGAQFIQGGVPDWIPAHLFWAYFVGLALLCAALSFILMRYVRWSGTLTGVMFFLFVVLLHVPRIVSNPGDRFAWAVALRDCAFAGGAWALSGTPVLVTAGRYALAIPVIFFAVEHFLHPNFAPGVPLPKVMSAWVPLGVLWGYLTGAALLVTGMALLLNKKARPAAAWTGLLLALLVLFIYVPLLLPASKPAEFTEAVNYIFDTLLFAGAILTVGRAMMPSPAYSGGSGSEAVEPLRATKP